MDGAYFAIRRKTDGQTIRSKGVSSAPRLYNSHGKADGRRKQLFKPDNYEVVMVQLTEIKD